MPGNGRISHAFSDNENEIIKRLSTYEDPELTKELYEFGVQLLDSRRNITSSIDTKAGVFAGFAGALIVIVVSTFASWKDLTKDWPTAADFLFLGLMALLLAAFFAVQALRTRTFQELDEKDLWFADEYFKFPDQLRRYYLIGMYRSVVSRDANNRKKTKMLICGEWLALAGAFFLAVPLLWETWHLGIGQQLSLIASYW